MKKIILGLLILGTTAMISCERVVSIDQDRTTYITDRDYIVMNNRYDRLKLENQDLEIRLEIEKDRNEKMQKELSLLEGKTKKMGDTSTLADPGVVENLIKGMK